jgi:hypothetical protein
MRKRAQVSAASDLRGDPAVQREGDELIAILVASARTARAR